MERWKEYFQNLMNSTEEQTKKETTVNTPSHGNEEAESGNEVQEIEMEEIVSAIKLCKGMSI